jgi:hypothetical protein
MNIPIQSSPVPRLAACSAVLHAVVASGNCSRNHWCCAGDGGTNPTCYPCNGTFGICGTPQYAFCQNLGLHVSDQC